MENEKTMNYNIIKNESFEKTEVLLSNLNVPRTLTTGRSAHMADGSRTFILPDIFSIFSLDVMRHTLPEDRDAIETNSRMFNPIRMNLAYVKALELIQRNKNVYINCGRLDQEQQFISYIMLYKLRELLIKNQIGHRCICIFTGSSPVGDRIKYDITTCLHRMSPDLLKMFIGDMSIDEVMTSVEVVNIRKMKGNISDNLRHYAGYCRFALFYDIELDHDFPIYQYISHLNMVDGFTWMAFSVVPRYIQYASESLVKFKRNTIRFETYMLNHMNEPFIALENNFYVPFVYNELGLDLCEVDRMKQMFNNNTETIHQEIYNREYDEDRISRLLKDKGLTECPTEFK